MKKLSLTLLVSFAFCISLPSIGQRTKPNVVLIMADDVSWECFGAYGSKEYHTPNIDALAKNGVQFNQCYSTPLCTPSRVEIMTGKYTFRNYTHFDYLNPQEKTFGHLMKEAGYKTAIAGKWQLNGVYYHKEGAEDNSRPIKAGFDEYCLWQLTKGVGGPKGGERFWSPVLEKNGQYLGKEDNKNLYGPDIMSDFLCDFMERNQDEPFFVYYPTVLVHDPFVPTPDNIGGRSRGHETNKEPKDPEAKKANFVAMVEYLDKMVGKIVNKLDEIGQLDNTIIIFTADNGTNRKITSQWMAQSIHGGKGTTTDMGTHVPLIVSWSGHTKAGTSSNDLVDFSDVYPTLSDIVGATPNTVDGRSFLPQILGKKGNPRIWQALYYHPYWGNGFLSESYVRNQDYKLYSDGRFYHVPNDLEQKNDLKSLNKKQQKIHDMLEKAVSKMPPLPEEKGPKAVNRPVYPDWESLYVND
ncbi:sulfatase-like hydrolase/transferase [Marinilongibacter aquaticus]|uniref:sulfatase-like hydrolase/transferase n=1 Tax=Marinilongibacter aquaticus TaxID=2975157 RepID=UPI0021BD6756|nr:sulfatase-like hydrolase/transferase [Marinilongibacter aquaticus]UBM59883.1 sulfatase-like hydrolase/transferase [Marinilongibacter aquaticus]